MLLYFMLILNMLFQDGRESQEQVFEWVVKAVTRTTYELNNHQSTLDQFVLSIQKCRNVRPNPLGKDSEVIFWHNFRTDVTPYAAVFNGTRERWFAFRLEPIINVLKNVLGKTFSTVEINRAIDESSWAMKGKALFYDCAMSGWPICKVHHDPETHVNINVPLTEQELVADFDPPHLVEQRCIFIKQEKYNEIVNSAERGGSIDVNYKEVTIQSSDQDIGEYNFFNAVTTEPWFGYRALGHCNFKRFNGAANLMMVSDDDLTISRDVEAENMAKGFGDVLTSYQPESLLEYYGYKFPDANALPPALLKIPFKMRNGPGDEVVDNNSPPWLRTYFGPSSCQVVQRMNGMEEEEEEEEEELITPARRTRLHEETMQTEWSGGSPTPRQSPGSTPLGDATLSRNRENEPPGRPVKRRRASRSVVDDENEVQQVRAHPNPAPPPTRTD